MQVLDRDGKAVQRRQLFWPGFLAHGLGFGGRLPGFVGDDGDEGPESRVVTLDAVEVVVDEIPRAELSFSDPRDLL